MLKVLPALMKCRLSVLNSHLLSYRLNTSARVLLATDSGSYKQDEMYFRNIVKKTAKLGDNEELVKEYDERRMKPFANITEDNRRSRYRNNAKEYENEDNENEDDEDGEGLVEEKKPKRVSREERKKLENKKSRELESNLKKVYQDFSQQKSADVRRNEEEKRSDKRSPTRVSERDYKRSPQQNWNNEAKKPIYGNISERSQRYQRYEGDSYKNEKRETGYFNKYSSKPAGTKFEKSKKIEFKHTSYDKSVFQRQQREAEEEMKEDEDAPAHVDNVENSNNNEKRSPKEFKNLKSFYEFDDEKKKFKQLDVQRNSHKEQETSLMVPNQVENELQVRRPQELELDEEKFMEEHIKSLKPAHRPFVYNLAYFVNDSKVLQKFIEMGIQIQRWDKNREIGEFILKLDFDRDVAPHLIFLHDLGCKTEDTAHIIHMNPAILKENLDNLKIRVNYLESKKFSKDEIASILIKAPTWLSMPVEEIDRNLGWFQKEFKLTSVELRSIIVNKPKLFVLPLKIPSDMRFSLKQFLRYDDEQIKTMLKTSPKLFTKKVDLIKNNYNYLIDVMKMSDAKIIETPEILHASFVLLKTRYSFLKHLKRDQFDPSKPNFVSLRDISSTTDEVFCKKIAQSSLTDYEHFLKSI